MNMWQVEELPRREDSANVVASDSFFEEEKQEASLSPSRKISISLSISTMMEEIRSSSPTATVAAATAGDNRVGKSGGAAARTKRNCLSFNASLQQGFTYVKAFLIGLVKKVTARNEKEAARADLETAKMQVDAADAAEDTKKKLDKSV